MLHAEIATTFGLKIVTIDKFSDLKTLNISKETKAIATVGNSVPKLV